MADPILELQGAIVARLKGTSAVTSLVGDRVYDRVPEPVTFPFISIGPADAVSDDAECIEGYEITLQVDAWSRAVGFPEVSAVADAVRRALTGSDLTLSDNALVSFTHRQTRRFRDPDGLTSHAPITFTAFVEQI